MSLFNKFKQTIMGMPLDPLSAGVRKSVLLVAFYAWIGLGSDGLSSVNYGPQEAFRALAAYPELAIFLVFAVIVTIFIIAGGYNQVIELFPSGGGGYKVCSQLLHPIAGLISGVALLMDYVLTITISAAAAVDALLSLIPRCAPVTILGLKILCIVLLSALNLRGTKESLKVMLPIFLSFVISHLVIIVLGIIMHEHALSHIIVQSVEQGAHVFSVLGFMPALVLVLKAYALGAGTYTGLEAVSNNVNILAKPRVQTGKWTMFYMSCSLSLMAGGILLMYLLFGVHEMGHRTFNAILFGNILGQGSWQHAVMWFLMITEVGILMLGANTGFLGGPAVLANMSSDRWMPNAFGNLSSRLVKQNGVLAFGIAAIVILLLTDGHVTTLVVLYSTMVFLAFSMTLFSLVYYWFKNFRSHRFIKWLGKCLQAIVGTVICVSILLVVVIEKFFQGGYLALICLCLLCWLCWRIRAHYQGFHRTLATIDRQLAPTSQDVIAQKPAAATLDPTEPTAVVFINQHPGLGVHTLLWVARLFPKHFKNFIFVQAGMVDIDSFRGEHELKQMQKQVQQNLAYFVDYVTKLGFKAESYALYGTNPIKELVDQTEKLAATYTHLLCFATKLVFKKSGLMSSLLHNRTATSIQNQLNTRAIKCLLLPMTIMF